MLLFVQIVMIMAMNEVLSSILEIDLLILLYLFTCYGETRFFILIDHSFGKMLNQGLGLI
jgi:hypothetical protein